MSTDNSPTGEANRERPAASAGTCLICPHCEKLLAGHDEKACVRRMSRRFFIGILGAAVVAAVPASPVVELATPKLYGRVPFGQIEVAEQIGWRIIRSRYSTEDFFRGNFSDPVSRTFEPGDFPVRSVPIDASAGSQAASPEAKQ